MNIKSYKWKLIIGILILILTFVTVPFIYSLLSHVGYEKNVQLYKINADIRVLTTSVNIYKKRFKKLPENLKLLMLENTDNKKNNILNKLPLDPWGKYYQYKIEDKNNFIFKIWTNNEGEIYLGAIESR